MAAPNIVDITQLPDKDLLAFMRAHPDILAKTGEWAKDKQRREAGEAFTKAQLELGESIETAIKGVIADFDLARIPEERKVKFTLEVTPTGYALTQVGSPKVKADGNAGAGAGGKKIGVTVDGTDYESIREWCVKSGEHDKVGYNHKCRDILNRRAKKNQWTVVYHDENGS